MQILRQLEWIKAIWGRANRALTESKDALGDLFVP